MIFRFILKEDFNIFFSLFKMNRVDGVRLHKFTKYKASIADSLMNRSKSWILTQQKARLSFDCQGIFPMQLYSKSGFIFLKRNVAWTVLVTIKYDSGSVAYFID